MGPATLLGCYRYARKSTERELDFNRWRRRPGLFYNTIESKLAIPTMGFHVLCLGSENKESGHEVTTVIVIQLPPAGYLLYIRHVTSFLIFTSLQ